MATSKCYDFSDLEELKPLFDGQFIQPAPRRTHRLCPRLHSHWAHPSQPMVRVAVLDQLWGVQVCPQLCCPSLCEQHCKGSRKPWDKHIHMGQVGEYMGIKREKKATAQSLQDYFSQRNYLTLKECKTWLLNDIKVWFSSGLAWPGSCPCCRQGPGVDVLTRHIWERWPKPLLDTETWGCLKPSQVAEILGQT